MPTDEEPKKKLRPTVIDPPARKKRNTDEPITSHQAIPTVNKPTVIPGEASKKILVTSTDLQKLSPGISADVYKKAIELITTLRADKATERTAILWGHELQKSYSDLVTQTLTLSQNPVLTKVQRYLNRMMTILGAIDLLAVCGHDSSGVFGPITKSVNLKIDTPFELNQSQHELGLLVQYMHDSLTQLLDLKAQLEQYSTQLDQIAKDIEASALAALFLSNYLQGSPIAQRFMERSMSLTQTQAQIRQNDAIRKIQIGQPLQMVNAIQNVALVMMPGLISSLASILTLMQSRRVSPTEAGELNDQLRNIVNQLKT